jgi:hypothetical protein
MDADTFTLLRSIIIVVFVLFGLAWVTDIAISAILSTLTGLIVTTIALLFATFMVGYNLGVIVGLILGVVSLLLVGGSWFGRLRPVSQRRGAGAGPLSRPPS